MDSKEMKYHVSDPPREKYTTIEKAPEDYYAEMIYKPQIIPENIKEELKHSKEKQVVNVGKKSKTINEKPKKIHSRANSTAMAKV